MAEVKYYCEECDGRTCTGTSNKPPKGGDPGACLWSNLVGHVVYASWAPRVSPADIIPKKESDTDG